MDIDFFFPETVVLESPDGSPSKKLKAQIDKANEILIYGDQTVISVDDVIVHTLGNGAVHRYSVLDANYQRGDADLPAVTRLQVSKEGSKQSGAHGGQHFYHVTGDNARINVHSSDRSTNIVTTSAKPIFKQLRAALEDLPANHPQKNELLSSVADLSSAPPQTAAFTEKFQHFMALAANCMTLVTPFLPEIVKMLGH